MAEPITVYDHIRQNNLRTMYLLILFPLSLIMLVFIACMIGAAIIDAPDFMMGGVQVIRSLWPGFMPNLNNVWEVYAWGSLGFTLYTVMPIFIVTSLWMLISYMFGDKMMLKFAEARKAKTKKDAKVYQAIENVAIMAGLPTPKAYIIEENSMNAFATGRSPKSASIALTRGLVENLTMEELEGVIAHEMAHIQNRDIRLNMLIITGLGIFGFMASLIRHSDLRIKPGGNKDSQHNLYIVIMMICIMTALMVFHYLVAPAIRFAVSRTREYAADATGALIIRNPKALASALRKLADDSEVKSVEDDPDMAAAFIANPLASKLGLAKLTSTHPPLISRIERLESM
ncbi:MAG: M48 family metallopeptidase [Lactobacillus sp.]|jgi:heat shock protein HtpX|nr:M48 family metallopeptidase [Lactobacillus sp.]